MRGTWFVFLVLTSFANRTTEMLHRQSERTASFLNSWKPIFFLSIKQFGRGRKCFPMIKRKTKISICDYWKLKTRKKKRFFSGRSQLIISSHDLVSLDSSLEQSNILWGIGKISFWATELLVALAKQENAIYDKIILIAER